MKLLGWFRRPIYTQLSVSVDVGDILVKERAEHAAQVQRLHEANNRYQQEARDLRGDFRELHQHLVDEGTMDGEMPDFQAGLMRGLDGIANIASRRGFSL